MIGIPTPRLTATIAPPVSKGALGAVTIEGEDGPPKPQGGVVGRSNRLLTCSRCHSTGHARSNRLCPARSK